MHFTRPRELLAAGLIGLVLGYLLFQAAYGSMPHLPTLAGTTLLVLGVIEAVLAFVIRNRITTRRVVLSVWIARAVALAKASSLLGALMLGVWAAGALYLGPESGQLSAAADDLPAAIVGIGCSIALIAAALWLEHCCRNPDSGDRDRDDRLTG